MAYIEPLLWESWGGVLVGILLLPPIIAAYMSYGKEPNREEFTLSKCFCFVSGTMAVWSWSHSPNCYHNRIAFYSVLLAGTLIYYHWEAMLISYLAVRTIVLPFNSLEELAYQTDFNVSKYLVDYLRLPNKSPYTFIFFSRILYSLHLELRTIRLLNMTNFQKCSIKNLIL